MNTNCVLIIIFSIFILFFWWKNSEVCDDEICDDEEINQELNKVLILAGIHGNERSPSIFFKNIIQDKFQDKFQIIPEANINALKKNIRGTPDLNRNWPHGTTRNRKLLPHILNTNIVVDFHEAWGNKCMPPSLGQSLYTTDENLKDLLEKIIFRLNTTISDECMKWRIMDTQEEIDGTLDVYCKKIGKPYILIEIMGQDSDIPLTERIRQLKIIYEELDKYF